jgi:4'-phosphopantetheinyl transferase
MESVLLDTPEGITARLGWNPAVSVDDRPRILAREIVAALEDCEPREISVDREAPRGYGYHAQLIASRAGQDLPYTVKTASFRAATVVAVSDPAVPLGIDIRDTHPGPADVRMMQKHSHLLDENDIPALVKHWTQVQAVLEADGRNVRVAGEQVRLDPARHKGWVPDRTVGYRLADLSRDGWIIAMAYGAMPVA